MLYVTGAEECFFVFCFCKRQLYGTNSTREWKINYIRTLKLVLMTVNPESVKSESRSREKSGDEHVLRVGHV
jgi:hypothetical protein